MLVALSLLALAPLAPLALASSCTFQEGAAGSLRVEVSLPTLHPAASSKGPPGGRSSG